VLQTDAPEYGVRIPLAKGLRDGVHYVEMLTESEPGTHVDIDGLLVRRRRSWLPYIIIPATAVLAVFLFGFSREMRLWG